MIIGIGYLKPWRTTMTTSQMKTDLRWFTTDTTHSLLSQDQSLINTNTHSNGIQD
jgi:hypothetical protein